MKLTGREIQVLTLIGQGCSNKLIAKDLCISIPTVRKHRQNIYKKLSVHSAAQLAIYAIDSCYVCNRDFYHLSRNAQQLTERELQVMCLASKGVSDRRIARTLHVAYSTVRKHRENIYLKMGFKNSAEMIAFFKFKFNAYDESTINDMNDLMKKTKCS